MNEAFGFGAEEGVGEGFFPNNFPGGGVEADGKDILPKFTCGFAAGGAFFEVGIAAFEEAEFAVGERDGGVNDEATGVGPVAFPAGF